MEATVLILVCSGAIFTGLILLALGQNKISSRSHAESILKGCGGALIQKMN